MKNSYDNGINADGGVLETQAFLRTNVIRTAIYQDTNTDRQLEEGIDAPCLVDDEVVQASPTRVNFSHFD
ncbi:MULTISPECIES: hypothetical protein [Halorussus]|uniref:Uncharacterized protein n=2 Tax=Halorussus TaxID=1070314 RepID=A0A8U0I331_9EURY|nr:MULTISPECIES: hypothetical protein [Halorussus]UPV77044.1 hypothetical protein M0R89_21745 [Halorussus limi]